MGSQMCKDSVHDHDLSMDPLSSQFTQTTSVAIAFQFNKILQNIKLIRQIADPRKNYALKWFQSRKYGFKLYGEVKFRRPIGECLFYFPQDFYSSQYKYQTQYQSQNQNHNKGKINNKEDKIVSEQKRKKKKPVIITSKINNFYQFSSNTLIIYNDKSYYIGQIQAKKYQIPRASGKGLLVTPQFIYEGQFQQGYPQGYGNYRTRFLQFTGTLKNGLPYGQCIEKTSKGIFIGRIDEKIKIGYMITPENKRIQIIEKINGSEIKLSSTKK